jgi:archaellum component FlaC
MDIIDRLADPFKATPQDVSDAHNEIERLREALKDINENMRQADRYFLKESTMAALKGNE